MVGACSKGEDAEGSDTPGQTDEYDVERFEFHNRQTMALDEVVSDVADDRAGNAARNASTVTNAQNAMNANDTNPNTSK